MHGSWSNPIKQGNTSNQWVLPPTFICCSCSSFPNQTFSAEAVKHKEFTASRTWMNVMINKRKKEKSQTYKVQWAKH